MLIRTALASALIFASASSALAEGSKALEAFGRLRDGVEVGKAVMDVARYHETRLTTNAMCSIVNDLIVERGPDEVLLRNHDAWQCCVLQETVALPASIVRMATVVPWTPSFSKPRRLAAAMMFAKEIHQWPEDALKADLVSAMDYAASQVGSKCNVAVSNFKP